MIKNSFIIGGFLKYFLFIITILTISQTTLLAGNIKNVEILKEEDRSYSINEVLKNSNLPFKKFESGESRKERKSFWLRFVYDKADHQKVYYLSSPYILNKKLDIYYMVKDSLHHYQTGIALGFDKRNLFLPNLYLELPTTNTPTICWLHIESFFGYSFYIIEDEIRSVIQTEIKVSTLEYFLVGISFLAGVFSLIFFIFLKDKLYFYYSIFSLMLIISRLTYSGYIFYYLNHFYEFPNLSSIFNLFTISYVGMNLAMLFYFHEFLKFYSKPQWYYLTLYVLIIIRFSLLIYQVAMPFDTHFIISHAIDLVIQFFFLVVIFKTPKKYRSLNILAASSLILLILGNLMLQPVFPLLFEGLSNYVFFLNLAGIEVFVFAINMAYRTYFLKKERELAMAKVVENLQERELLKDRLNKELEIKVEERTQQIQKMNELLKSHNIELKSEVAHANEARVFQKIMDFSDFQRIFPDDEACYQYLAKLKWKPNEITYCKKCGSKASPNYEKLSIRCGKCKYLESVTNNTLFQKLKFPILKAFYITYRLSTATNDSITMASLAEEIELRPATLWTFKQKVIALKDANKSRKKHKDGWTHLIEYSIIKDIIGDK